MGTASQVTKGFKWTAFEMIFNRGLGLFVKLILARLLLPKDYGLIGMASFFTGYMVLFNELGFGTAIIQRPQEKLSQNYYSTAFWSSLIWTIILYIILIVFVNPFSVKFFNEPQLYSLIPVMGLALAVSPLTNVQRSILAKRMDFKRISVIKSVAIFLGSALAVLLAYLGKGVWAIVWQLVSSAFLEIVLTFLLISWRPSFVFDKESFKDMFGFGIFTTLTALVFRISSDGDYAIVGRFYDKIQLGFYSFAFILTDSFRTQIRQVIDRVLFPLYSKFQHDLAIQARLFKMSISYNSMIIVPILGFLFSFPEVILLIFGAKWAPSIPVIQIIVLASIVQILVSPIAAVLRSNDKTKLDFYVELLVVCLFFLPIVIFATWKYGIIGCAVGVLVVRVLTAIVKLQVLKSVIHIDLKGLMFEYFLALIPTAIAVLIAVLVIGSDNDSMGRIVFKILSYGAVVLGISALLFKSRIKHAFELYRKN